MTCGQLCARDQKVSGRGAAKIAVEMDTRLGAQSFPADATHLHRIRTYIRECADQAALTPDMTGDILIAVSEACANSAIHTDCASLTVRWEAAEDRVEVAVEDDGVFAGQIPVPELDGNGRGGRGIPIMMALMDEVSISQGTDEEPGTVVRLVKFPAA